MDGQTPVCKNPDGTWNHQIISCSYFSPKYLSDSSEKPKLMRLSDALRLGYVQMDGHTPNAKKCTDTDGQKDAGSRKSGRNLESPDN